MYQFLKNVDDEKCCICIFVYKMIFLEEEDIFIKMIRKIRMIGYFNIDINVYF